MSDVFPRSRRQGVRLAVCALTAVLSLPSPASAVVFYQSYAGFNPGGFNIFHGQQVVPTTAEALNFGGCPVPGTPNALCGSVLGAAGISGGRLFLRAEARLRRGLAQPVNPQNPEQLAAYGGGRIDLYGLSGYTSGPVGAYFSFGLSGTIANSTNDLNVTTQSFAIANLYAGSGSAVQCVSPVSCLPSSVQMLKVTNWDPADGFSLALRSDVALSAPVGVSGYDVDVVADFADTLELLAIQLLDENDQPIPGVTLSFTDVDGNVFVIPDTPPTPTPTATPTTTPTVTVAPPTPTPTATPCASPPCEDCENCLDDDGDALVDRADPDCMPPANGAGSSVADPHAAKPLGKCAKALQQAGSKFAIAKLKLVHGCLRAAAKCVQLKPDDPGCLSKAGAVCAKLLSKVAPRGNALLGAVTRACGEPGVAASDLEISSGLGYGGEIDACARRGVPDLATVADVGQCVLRQHACIVDRIVAATLPRAGAMLVLVGRDPASDLPCLTGGADGSTGVIESKRKAVSQCDLALRKSAAKLVAGRLKTVQACSRGVFACVQLKNGDQSCLDKSAAKCTKAVGRLPSLEEKLAAALIKKCDTAPLNVADLLAPAGLGFNADTSTCAGLGVASLDTVADLATCLTRVLACRVDQLLDVQTPRTRELVELGGVDLH